jgi:hypothetical protein
MFFPLLLWMVVWSVIAINNEIKETSVAPIFYSCIFGSLLILYCFSDFTNYTRLNIDNPKQANWTRVHWLKNGAAIMDKLGIPKNENILALNENSPNETLVYFDRKGYIYESGRWYDGNSIAVEPFMKERNLTIAVVETKAFRERILSDSLIFRNFSELYSDENATVLKLKTY